MRTPRLHRWFSSVRFWDLIAPLRPSSILRLGEDISEAIGGAGASPKRKKNKNIKLDLLILEDRFFPGTASGVLALGTVTTSLGMLDRLLPKLDMLDRVQSIPTRDVSSTSEDPSGCSTVSRPCYPDTPGYSAPASQWTVIGISSGESGGHAASLTSSNQSSGTNDPLVFNQPWANNFDADPLADLLPGDLMPAAPHHGGSNGSGSSDSGLSHPTAPQDGGSGGPAPSAPATEVGGSSGYAALVGPLSPSANSLPLNFVPTNSSLGQTGASNLSPLATRHSPPAPPIVHPQIYGNWQQPPQGLANPFVGVSPLWVLDANKAIVLTPGIIQHDFSTYTVDLRAQLSGVSVSSYSWNTTSAADASSISGASTYRLQFTWASFTGVARNDSITLTVTKTDQSTLVQTFSFVVASTTSPAYAASPPTSFSSWPSVVTPDANTDQQMTSGAGPYYRFGLNQGDLQVDHALPGYNPGVTPLDLQYNSLSADPRPIFIDRFVIDDSQAVPPTVKAKLTLNGSAASAYWYTTSGLIPGDILQIALQKDANSLATGRYSYSVATTANYTTPVTVPLPEMHVTLAA